MRKIFRKSQKLRFNPPSPPIALKNKEEDRILHIIISRQEYDLKDIKLSYMGATGQSLENTLNFETDTFKANDVLQLLIQDYNY